ncbi:hypothetical protein SUGI_0877210 [Cryptomeria japonica]|nr:hypothetical protein SUGI_0877210 [Cryptomeria japonica]
MNAAADFLATVGIDQTPFSALHCDRGKGRGDFGFACFKCLYTKGFYGPSAAIPSTELKGCVLSAFLPVQYSWGWFGRRPSGIGRPAISGIQW